MFCDFTDNSCGVTVSCGEDLCAAVPCVGFAWQLEEAALACRVDHVNVTANKCHGVGKGHGGLKLV